MLSLPEYPLKQILQVKERRKEQAEEELKKRKQELEEEIAKLRKAEEKRDKVLNHFREKLAQLRHELDHETTTEEIQKMKRYLEVVKEKLQVEEEKVKAQQEQVELAEKNVELAREELRRRTVEVDKMYTHREYWIKQAKEELLQAEAAVMDEIGNILYEANKRKWE